MNASSYLLAVFVVGTGIFALGPHHVVSSNAVSARQAVRASTAAPSATVSLANSPEPSTSAMPPTQSKIAAPSAAATVDTKDFTYAPATVTVPAGSTVRFKNSDSMAHTITAADRSFDSKDLAEGESWSHVFATAGTYAYYCSYHRYMKGKIVVK